VNKYEIFIEDYENSIGIHANTYFNIKNNEPKIFNRAFYKLWEIII
jgi:hypothetical protein